MALVALGFAIILSVMGCGSKPDSKPLNDEGNEIIVHDDTPGDGFDDEVTDRSFYMGEHDQAKAISDLFASWEYDQPTICERASYDIVAFTQIVSNQLQNGRVDPAFIHRFVSEIYCTTPPPPVTVTEENGNTYELDEDGERILLDEFGEPY